MIRPIAVLAALAALAAACSGGTDEAASKPGTTTGAAPQATIESVETETAPGEPGRPPTKVIVADGDTRHRLEGALVRTGKANLKRADARGRADLQTGGRKRFTLRVSARGYMPEQVTVRPRGRNVLVRLYRRELQWPIYGATPARTQAHPAIRLRPPFRPIWARGVGSLIEFPAVVWKGVAYVDSIEGDTTALSMGNGKVLWRTRVGTRMAASPAVVPERNELVVVTFSPGEVVVLDLRSGRVKYRRSIGRAEPSPVIRDGIAYFATTNGNVYALDLERRRWRWVHANGVKITSSPALRGNRLYLGDYAGRVLCLDTRTGRTIWIGSAGSRVYGTVAVGGGKVFAPSVFSGLSALSARTGRLLWRRGDGSYLYSSPAYYRGRVFYGTYAGVVYSADAGTGRTRWVQGAGGRVSGAVQVVAGVVYAGSLENRITAWGWRHGKRLWEFPHGKYVAVSGNGGRLLMHGYSKIWAVVPVQGKKQ